MSLNRQKEVKNYPSGSHFRSTMERIEVIRYTRKSKQR